MQPPASLKALNDPIYEAFYGLTEQPFAITTDPRFFYLSASHQRAFSELLNGLRRREGLLMLTGETGIGKTTLCRAVLATLGDRTFSAIILNPYMTGAEVLRIVLRDFGLVSHEELRRGGLATADVAQLLDTLEGFLKSLVPLGSHAVIVLDEAQALTPQVLDQIRMLTGLEHEGKRLVQVVLCGQPALLQTIKSDALLALNERITRRVELTALPAEDVRGYIEHRLGVAGAGDAVRFDAAATQAVAELSRGLPRRINVLCDRALQEGRIEGVSVITADLVKRAARGLAGVHDPLPILPSESPKPAAASSFTPAARVAAPPVSAAAPPPVAPAPTTAPLPEPSATTAAASVAPATPPAPAEPARDEQQEPRPDVAEVITPVAATAAVPALAAQAAELQAPIVSAPPQPAAPVPTPAPVPQAAPVPAPTPAPEPAPAPEVAARVTAAPPLPSPPRAAAGPGVSEFLPEKREPAAAAETRELSFGQEAPHAGRGAWLRMAAAVVAVIAAIGGGGYAAWGWPAIDGATVVPAAPPAAPRLDRGAPPPAVPLTTVEELQALHPVRRYFAPPPDPVVDTPPEAAFPMPEGSMDSTPAFPRSF